MTDEKQFQELMVKLKAAKEGAGIDLSLEEDLSIALMNLISLEEHFFFTGAKTGKDEYYDLLERVREVRKELLGRMIDKGEHEGETWCISKHLLAATVRMIEVGTKYYAEGKKDDAKKLFGNASTIFNLFWALRLKLIGVKDVKAIKDDQVNVHDEHGTKQPWSLQDIMNKLVDCCDE